MNTIKKPNRTSNSNPDLCVITSYTSSKASEVEYDEETKKERDNE